MSFDIKGTESKRRSSAMQGEGDPAKTAMIIHDEAYVSYALAGFLRAQGFEIVALGHDLRVAEQINPSSEPDLCILGELRLCKPGLIAQLRERFPEMRIALFAADTLDPLEAKVEINRAREIGFDAFLPAYFSDEKIIRSIARLMAGKTVFPKIALRSCQIDEEHWPKPIPVSTDLANAHARSSTERTPYFSS